MFTMILLLRQL